MGGSDELKLIPLIVQDAATKQVLSLVYANSESIELMKKTGFVHRYSRQARAQMRKGETSGNFQKIISLDEDCDGMHCSRLLIKRKRACHAGAGLAFLRIGRLATGF